MAKNLFFFPSLPLSLKYVSFLLKNAIFLLTRDMDGPVPSRAGPPSSVNLIMQSLCFQLASEVDFKAMTHACFQAEDPQSGSVPELCAQARPLERESSKAKGFTKVSASLYAGNRTVWL